MVNKINEPYEVDMSVGLDTVHSGRPVGYYAWAEYGFAITDVRGILPENPKETDEIITP